MLTPDLLFWGINAMFGPLVLDLFADDSSKMSGMVCIPLKIMR